MLGNQGKNINSINLENLKIRGLMLMTACDFPCSQLLTYIDQCGPYLCLIQVIQKHIPHLVSSQNFTWIEVIYIVALIKAWKKRMRSIIESKLQSPFLSASMNVKVHISDIEVKFGGMHLAREHVIWMIWVEQSQGTR